ncbi:putative Homeobox protein 32 [Hibiscus syriacus]|uniref:Homeobox protein 32 n=1 Tax=Hibiscus syriacus TaxID=106335 RepID=A0A6A3BRX7_HIBSY|nr:putative Homeobox protein 32 [Hibiscus syriacus]
MSIWKRAAAAIKDKKSLIVAYFSTRSSHRDLDFKAAIIKATSHDEYDVGERHAQIVLWRIRASPNNVYPLIRVLSKMMEKTRSWMVAIKGLMLMQDLIHRKIPAIEKMDCLPFDLSSFGDERSNISKTWGFDIFIRRYLAFLDERCGIWLEEEEETAKDSPLMVQQLSKLRKLQLLLDMLLKIRPPAAGKRKACLIFEAMDCVVIEIFDFYSRICNKIAEVLLEVHSVGKLQASMALEILRKATTQEEDVEELKRIINGASDKTYEDGGFRKKNQTALVVREERNAIVEHRDKKETLKTIIIDKWEVFDDDINHTADDQQEAVNNPFEIPDLISF